MEDPALRTDREAIAWWLRRLLRARGLRRELARRIPMAPETLSRLLSPEDPTRASLPTARRVVEVLQETLMERGVRLAPEEADLIAAYLRDKLRFAAVRPDPAGDRRPSDEALRRRAEELLGLYRRTGTVLNAPGGASVFRRDYLLMEREALGLLREAEALRRSGRTSAALMEAELCALAVAGLAGSGVGEYGRAFVLTARAFRQALEALRHPHEVLAGGEADRRRMGHHLLRALESHLVLLYNLGEPEAAARGYEQGLDLLGRLDFFLPADLLRSWSLDYRLNRLHALARAGRLPLPEARRAYEELREAIAKGPVLPLEFPPPAAEAAARRMRIYAWQGWAKACLSRGRGAYALEKLLVEGESLLAQDPGLPLRIALLRTLAALCRQAGDQEGWRAYAREAARLAWEAGLLHHLDRIRREFGPEARRLLEDLGLPPPDRWMRVGQ
jgi:hypothetical protein